MAGSTMTMRVMASGDAWLRQEGFTVLRFWNHEILQDTDAVLTTSWAAVSERLPLSLLDVCVEPSPARGEA